MQDTLLSIGKSVILQKFNKFDDAFPLDPAQSSIPDHTGMAEVERLTRDAVSRQQKSTKAAVDLDTIEGPTKVTLFALQGLQMAEQNAIEKDTMFDMQ